MLADGQASLCWRSKQVTNWKKQFAGRRKLNQHTCSQGSEEKDCKHGTRYRKRCTFGKLKGHLEIKKLKITKIETRVYIVTNFKETNKQTIRIRKYCEKLYINILEKLVKMDRFLEKHKLSELTQREGGS